MTAGQCSRSPDRSRTEVAEAGPVPATVPGTVHTDLMAAGCIPDPYLDDNERLLSWIGLVGLAVRDDLRVDAR